MNTRMSIGLPPAPKEFVDDALDVVNAMRTIRHHRRNGTDAVDPVDGGMVQRTVQGTATFVRDGQGLTVAYEPDRDAAAGFEPVVFRLSRSAYPDSPLWTISEHGLVTVFAEHAGALTDDGRLVGYRTGVDERECVAILEAHAGEDALEIEGLVEDLSNGTDVAAGGAWSIRRRWNAFGAPSLAEATGDDNVVYRVPSEDEPDSGRRQAGFRIRLIERFMRVLPPAIMIVRAPDGTYDTMPYSLTRSRPEPQDADSVRRKAVHAFHRLTTIASQGSC